MRSIWSETVSLPRFPVLEGDKKTDVLIIGGGMAGILCAYYLQKKGVDYILAEGKSIGAGITANTTAKITVQHGLIYHQLLRSVGKEKAAMYMQANQKALEEYSDLCRHVDCDFQYKTAYVYSLKDRRKLEKEAEALEHLGISGSILDETKLPFPVAGAIAFENQAQFHPLKFLASVVKSLNIYEHSFVKELKEKTAVTDRGTIAFQKAIFATHFPVDNKHGMYFLKLYQHRSYVIALEHAADLDGMYVDESKYGMSFRNYGDLLFVGGGDHRTGKRGGNWQELRDFAKRYYPLANEIGFWATQDCMSLDKIPYIGPYSPHMKNCYVATGFNKWGITSSMISAMLLTDLILERKNPWAEVFCPSRSMLKPQLFLNGCEAVKNLLTITGKRCPHMGCALKWNGTEHSWDCPCHGSRFDEAGGLLDNPANGNCEKLQ